MACLDMYNSEHKGYHHHLDQVSPRISFSNDFVDTQQATKQEQLRSSTRSEAPVSSDFEFSVSNYSMMSADELFFKGRLLPFKDKQRPTTTLREELLLDHDDDGVDQFRDFSLRPPKGSSTKWKGFLGLRKSSHLGSSKKVDKSCNEGSSDRGVEPRRSPLFNEDTSSATLNLTSQEMLNERGANCRDVEIGL